MASHPALESIAKQILENPDRYAAHEQIGERVEAFCNDREALHTALRECVSRPGFLDTRDNLSFPLIESGDIMIYINLFSPLRDRAAFVTHDNIHHHGWRLLTTGVLSGDGYDAIDFVHRSHEKRDGDRVLLEVKEVYRHEPGGTRFIDSYAAHTVFHPNDVVATLAVWSADKPMVNQGLKRSLQGLPAVRQLVAKGIRALKLETVFGLNKVGGLYYHPQGGKIVETQSYSKPFDGTNEEILRCMFTFFQQVEFTDASFWQDYRKTAAKHVVPFIDMLLAGDPIPDVGLWGNPRRRFTKTQVLQAIDNSYVAGE